MDDRGRPREGTELEARAFPKDARVNQGAIVSNKYLAGALEDIQQRQIARDEVTLATKRLTLRDEDLLRRRMGRKPLATRRKDDRKQKVPKKDDAKAADSTPLVDAIVADTLRALATPAE